MPDDQKTEDLPEVQVLMAAVIRLMAKCALEEDAAPMGVLLKLINELRMHPDLLRRPAVLAGLAEAHSVWLHRVNTAADVQDASVTVDEGDNHKRRLH